MVDEKGGMINDPIVLPCATHLDGDSGRFTVVIEAPLPAFGKDAEANCRVLRAELERLIRSDPADFLWGQRIFHHQEGLRPGEVYMPKDPWTQYRRIRTERGKAE